MRYVKRALIVPVVLTGYVAAGCNPPPPPTQPEAATNRGAPFHGSKDKGKAVMEDTVPPPKK